MNARLPLDPHSILGMVAVTIGRTGVRILTQCGRHALANIVYSAQATFLSVQRKAGRSLGVTSTIIAGKKILGLECTLEDWR
ncbi:MAG: hypothetical protein ACE5JU_11555 [Candidatus Binatia bacterium]